MHFKNKTCRQYSVYRSFHCSVNEPSNTVWKKKLIEKCTHLNITNECAPPPRNNTCYYACGTYFIIHSDFSNSTVGLPCMKITEGRYSSVAHKHMQQLFPSRSFELRIRMGFRTTNEYTRRPRNIVGSRYIIGSCIIV